jgi:hypothetical protein
MLETTFSLIPEQQPYAPGVSSNVMVIEADKNLVLNANKSLLCQPTHATIPETPIISTVPTAVFPIKLNGYHFQALLDTGANISLLKASVAQQLQLRPGKLSSGLATGITGQKFKLDGCAQVHIQMDKRLLLHQLMYIIDTCPYDVIIGMDVLQQLRVLTLSFANNKLYLYTTPSQSVVHENPTDVPNDTTRPRPTLTCTIDSCKNKLDPNHNITNRKRKISENNLTHGKPSECSTTSFAKERALIKEPICHISKIKPPKVPEPEIPYNFKKIEMRRYNDQYLFDDKPLRRRNQNDWKRNDKHK